MQGEISELILEKKVIAICRGIYGSELLSLAAALQRGGIRLVEVTFDQSDPACLEKTACAISALHGHFDHLAVGAGTVLTDGQLNAAIASGAQFIISPNVNIELIRKTRAAGLISIPGAMTPTEVERAHQAGAHFVKLFPCDNLGPAYVQAIRSPLSHIRLIATGGIDADNLRDYLSLGMAGAGIGGKLCDRRLVSDGRFDLLEKTARACAQAAEAF